MPSTINCLLVLFCVGFSASLKVGVLTHKEIEKIKPKFVGDVNSESDWKNAFDTTGDAMLPVTQLAINSVAAATIGVFIALAGHNGHVLHNLASLPENQVKVLIVVFDPKIERDAAAHTACLSYLINLKTKHPNLKIYDYADKKTHDEHTQELGLKFNFDGFKEDNDVVEELSSVNVLVVSLCGATVANIKRDQNNNIPITDAEEKKINDVSPKLFAALDLLPKIVQDQKVVLSPNAANGQADDGSWPLKNKHRCTHIPTQYWPMGALETAETDGTKNYILQTSFLDKLSGSDVEKYVEPLRKEFNGTTYAQVVYDTAAKK